MGSPAASNQPTRQRWLALLAVFLVVFGARLWLIDRFGSPVPYMDQWDAEAQMVIKPWLNGEFSLAGLFSAHNEHRVLNSRLLTLALFCGNGQWDPLLEAVASSFLYAVLAVISVVGFSRLVEPRFRGAILIAVTLMGALPFGWENTLVGFQSQFYLLVLFSLLAMWGLGIQAPLSRGWWLGAAAGMLACLSMGSGFFAGAAVLAAMGMLFIKNPAAGWRRGDLATAAVCLGLILFGFLTRTVVPGHAVLRAQTIGVFVKSFGQCLAWPWSANPAAALLVYAPLAALWWRSLRRDEGRDPFRTRGFLLMSIWVVAQCAATSLLRGGGWQYPPSRYSDLLAFGVLLNFCALLNLLGGAYALRRWRPAVFVAALLWVMFAGLGLARQTYTDVTAHLPAIRRRLQTQEKNVRDFVLTGDPSFVVGKKYPEIPYPDSSSITRVLADPKFRAILPPALLQEAHDSPNLALPDRGPLSVGSDYLLQHAWLVFGAGVFLWVLSPFADRLLANRNVREASPP